MVKHVPNEELLAIPTAAEDLFIIGGKDAFQKRQVSSWLVFVLVCYHDRAEIHLLI